MQELTVVTEKIEQEIKSMDVKVTQAIAAIRDESSCDIAADIARQCANQIDVIEATFRENLTDARRAYENLRDKVAMLQKPYREWRAAITKGVGDWRTAIKREIEEQNRKAIEAEEKEARIKAEREAAKLEKKGEPEMAAVVRQNAVSFVPPLQEPPKNKGIVDKVTWCVTIKEQEKWKLIKYLVEGGPANMDAITINAGYLKKLAALRHEEMKEWPGIIVYPETSSEIRRDRRIA